MQGLLDESTKIENDSIVLDYDLVGQLMPLLVTNIGSPVPSSIREITVIANRHNIECRFDRSSPSFNAIIPILPMDIDIDKITAFSISVGRDCVSLFALREHLDINVPVDVGIVLFSKVWYPVSMWIGATHMNSTIKVKSTY